MSMEIIGILHLQRIVGHYHLRFEVFLCISKIKLLLSQLVHTDKPTFNIKIANVSKQSGTSDCGLYAIAYMFTCVKFKSVLLLSILEKNGDM